MMGAVDTRRCLCERFTMVFVQHVLTQLYLRSFAEWTRELNEAWVFETTDEAVRFCEMSGLTDVQIIVPSPSDVQCLPLPPRHLSIPAAQIPVILPRTDSRPN
jgi:hypothetical protein